MIEVVGLLLILLAVPAWLSALILVRAAFKEPRIPLLTVVAVGSLMAALAATGLVPLAVDAITPEALVPQEIRIGLLVIAILLFSLPGPAFLVLYHFGYFEGNGNGP
jgi:hypothetical protein